MIKQDAWIALQLSIMGSVEEVQEGWKRGGVTQSTKRKIQPTDIIAEAEVQDDRRAPRKRNKMKRNYKYRFYWIASLFMLHYVRVLVISQMLHGVSSFIPYSYGHNFYSSKHASSTFKYSMSEEFPFSSNDDDENVDYFYGPPSSFASHERSYVPSTGTSSGPTTPTRVNTRNRIVWIIDDEQPILDAVGSYLTSVGGYEVYPFLNATLPLALLSQTQSQSLFNGNENDPDKNDRNAQVMVPDAIISDVRMPHISGIDLLTMIRSSTINSILNMPFILLTARSHVEDRVRGYEAGTDGYLTKPFDPEELVVLLERMIQRKEWLVDTAQSSVTLEELKGDLEEIKEALSKEEANLFLNASSKRMQGGRVDQTLQSIENIEIDLDYSYSEEEDDDDDTPLLDPDEMDVLELLCQGYMNKEIAFELQYSIRWVEIRLTAMYRKTGCANRTELVRWAIANDFVDM